MSVSEHLLMIENAKVHIIDDNFKFCVTWKCLLEKHGYSVSVYQNSDSFFSDYKPNVPECFLVDLRLGDDESGEELFYKIKNSGISGPCIFFSGYATIELTAQLMKKGAFYLIEKTAKPIDVLQVIQEAIYSGQENNNLNIKLLTENECKVYKMMVNGQTVEQTASELLISKRTVEFHRTNIFRKLGVKSMKEVILHSKS
jgi:FixJ family two-component response regulator